VWGLLYSLFQYEAEIVKVLERLDQVIGDSVVNVFKLLCQGWNSLLESDERMASCVSVKTC